MHVEAEQQIENLHHRYLIFIDEVGDPQVHADPQRYNDPSIFPVLTVTGLIVERNAYIEVMRPGLDAIKQWLFHRPAIYFHSREIRRKDGIFKVLLDPPVYAEFKNRMNALYEKSAVTIVTSSINKMNLLRKAQTYKQRTGETYSIGDIYLRNVDYVLERIGHFLKENDGKIIFELRGKKESRRIQGVLTDAKENGTFYCDQHRFKNVDGSIMFFGKKDNVAGLQMVDYCSYPFARHAKNALDNDNQFFEILRKYVYKGNYGEYGLKEWP